jgi:hypothetical protein
MVMRTLFFICVSMIILSCKNDQQQNTVQETIGTKDTLVVAAKPQSEQKIIKEDELAVVDTGQTWFRVKITKNDSAFMDYEGSWPVFFESNNSATLQLSKSKKIMSVTDILTIYMNGVPSGKAPIVLSNREKGTVSMIMSPVTDGAYGLPISPTEGFFTITKNVNSVVSGNFEGKAIDSNKDVFLFKGYFLNAKINPDKI